MDDARDGEVVRRKPRQHLDNLTAPEREAFLKPLLPPARPEACADDEDDDGGNNTSVDDDDDGGGDDESEPSPPFAGQRRPRRRARAGQTRTFLTTQFYLLVYTVVHTLFALYLRLRRAYHAVTNGVFSVLYYHHRTPELIQRDVKRLGRLPEHLSVLVSLKPTAQHGGSSGGGSGGHAAAGTALEQLMDEVAEIAAWCACAGIPALSVYEKTGVLKSYMATLHRIVAAKLHAYCGRRRPRLQLRAPHVHPYMNGDTFDGDDTPYSSNGRLSVLLIAAEDGRDSIVDLTKTLAEMAQRGKVNPDDISLELIDIELSENVMAEPDMLIVFAPYVDLQGYPPWQVRLTEIFHVQDCDGVGYQVFLRGLHRYAKAQMRFGR